jgi:hypothetical protein
MKELQNKIVEEGENHRGKNWGYLDDQWTKNDKTKKGEPQQA